MADWLSDLEFEVIDGVAVVTLSRPDHRNAFSAQMGEELGWAYSRCDADDAIRAVVVTGAGDAFCAGADLTPAGDTFASPASPTPTMRIRRRARSARRRSDRPRGRCASP